MKDVIEAMRKLDKNCEHPNYYERLNKQADLADFDKGALASTIFAMMEVMQELIDQGDSPFKEGFEMPLPKGYKGPVIDWTTEQQALAFGLLQGLLIGVIASKDQDDGIWWAEDVN